MGDLILTIIWVATLLVAAYFLLVKAAWIKTIAKVCAGPFLYYSRVIVTLVIAALIFWVAQIRELLPGFGPETPLALIAKIQSSGWDGFNEFVWHPENLTTMVVTITLAVFPMIRPDWDYSLEGKWEIAVIFAGNLLVACLYPAIIAFHTALAIHPEFSAWSGILAGLYVYLQWVITYSFVAIVLTGVIWLPKLGESFPEAWKFAKSGNVISVYVGAVFLVIAVTSILLALISVSTVLLFPLSVGAQFALDLDLGEKATSTVVVTNMFIAATMGLIKLDEFLMARVRVSIIGVFLFVALALALADLNDSHRIREIAASKSAADHRNDELISSFQKWKSHRSIDEASKPYPIYIVAAQGGGIYAAYHSAEFLATAQDMSPNFADHLFAISGVSGGALGAATFASLVHQAEGAVIKDDSWYRIRTDAMLGQDFLTSTIWTTLFTDPWSRIIPCIKSFCPGQKLSRAGTFERTLERAWQNTLSTVRNEENVFVNSVYEHWSPDARTPALFLNTTEVETGENVVISSAGSLMDGSNSTLRWLSQRAPNLNISLSTAVSLSARFPGLAPAGWYRSDVSNENKKTVKRRLVDGGYYDNSGVSTAISIINALEPYKGNGRFVLISLDSVTETALAPTSAGGLGELMSPLKALGSTRAARGRLAIEQAFISLDGTTCVGPPAAPEASCVFGGSMRTSTLATREPVPLGWQLLEGSRAAIRWSIGDAKDCTKPDQALLKSTPQPDQDDWQAAVENVRIHNSCLLATIRDELT